MFSDYNSVTLNNSKGIVMLWNAWNIILVEFYGPCFSVRFANYANYLCVRSGLNVFDDTKAHQSTRTELIAIESNTQHSTGYKSHAQTFHKNVWLCCPLAGLCGLMEGLWRHTIVNFQLCFEFQHRNPHANCTAIICDVQLNCIEATKASKRWAGKMYERFRFIAKFMCI